MIRILAIAEIGEALDRAIPILERLQAKGECDWTVASLRDGLLSGELSFLFFDDYAFGITGETDGFMYVWIAASFNGVDDALARHAAELDALARSRGLHGFIFSTSRKGWERTAKRAGFKEYNRTVMYQYVGGTQ